MDCMIVFVQNATLSQQLLELRQRYSRAKQTMKLAQEKLDENSRRKEQLRLQRNINNDAIIAESKSRNLTIIIIVFNIKQ